MTTIAQSLLDFILALLKDPELREEYEKDPQGTLDGHGLHDVTPEDVAAVMDMEADYAPVHHYGKRDDDYDKDHDYGKDHDRCDDDDKGPWYGGGHDRDDKDYGKDHDRCDDDDDKGHKDYDKRDDCDDDKDGYGNGKHDSGGQDVAAVTHVKYVENNYAVEKNYTEIDVDIDASNSIWAGGDVYKIWGEDFAVATGNGVALNDVEVERGSTLTIDQSTTTTTTNTIEGSFNKDSNVATGGGDVNDNDVDLDLEIEDSFNGNAIGEGNTVDNSKTDVDVELKDSLNGNTVVGGDQTNTDLDLKTDNIIVGDDNVAVSDKGSYVENDVEVEDNENSVINVATAGDDAEAEQEEIQNLEADDIEAPTAINQGDGEAEAEDETKQLGLVNVDDTEVDVDVELDPFVNGALEPAAG